VEGLILMTEPNRSEIASIITTTRQESRGALAIKYIRFINF